MIRLNVAILLLLVSSTLAAEDQLTPPQQSPEWIVLNFVDNDRIGIAQPAGFLPVKRTQVVEVQVPYIETGANGEKIQKTRTENREREIIALEKHNVPALIRWATKDVSFFDINGNPLDFASNVKDRLQSGPIPSLSIEKDSRLDPFFAAILKPDTVVVVVPRPNRPKLPAR